MLTANVKIKYIPKRNVKKDVVISSLKECIYFILGLSPKTEIIYMMRLTDDDKVYTQINKDNMSVVIKNENDTYNIEVTINQDVSSKEIAYKLFDLFDKTSLFHNFEVIPDETIVYNDNIEILRYVDIDTYIPDGGIKTEPLSAKKDNIMTIKQWIKLTSGICPLIMDYDGFGYFVIKKNGKYFETNVPAVPGELISEYIKSNFTHVVWFNK